MCPLKSLQDSKSPLNTFIDYYRAFDLTQSWNKAVVVLKDKNNVRYEYSPKSFR